MVKKDKMNTMNLRVKIIHSLGWNVSGAVITSILGLATKIVTARILFPEDFGLFAMAFIVLGFLGIFVGFGMLSTIIYKTDNTQKTLNAAFILSLLSGIILSLLCYFSSSFVANFFNEPTLNIVIKILSISLIFDSISSVLYAVLLKDLNFKRKTIADILSIIVYSVTVITLAFNGFGIWSLVIAYVTQHFFLVLFLWIACPKKPIFEIELSTLKEVFHFGKYVTSASFFAWIITSIDNIIVGKKLGDESLGYYSFGFNIATLPVLAFTHLITGVFHPIYAKVQNDVEKLKEAYLKPLEWTLLLIFPTSMGLFLLADMITITLFGEKWLAIIPILKMLAIYGILRTVCAIIAQLFEAVGKPFLATRIVFMELVILVVFISSFISFFGLLGVAMGVILARAIAMIIYLYEINKLLGIKMKTYFLLLSRKIIATLIMGGFLSFSLLFVSPKNTLLNLCFFIVLGFFIYGSTLFLLERKMFIEARNLLLF